MLSLYFSFYFILLLYDSGTANQISKLCSWFQRLETSTSLSLKKKQNKCKGKCNWAKPNWICLYFVFVVIAFEYCFLSFFFNLWVSPYISICHYIFVFICYPDFIYESCRQILWRAFLRRCSEGKKGNQNWRGLLFFRPLWMSINPEDCWDLPVDPFLLSGNRHLFNLPFLLLLLQNVIS